MTAKILDGKHVAALLRANIKQQIAQYINQSGAQPTLAVILVGIDPASQIYVNNKRKACDQVGIKSRVYQLPATTSQREIMQLIAELNNDVTVNGILVQLPLPAHIKQEQILLAIDPMKDVDGFHPYNLGCLAQKRPSIRPCTPYGVMKLLAHYQLSVSGLNATVVGASNIAGRPMALELLNAGATITVCHSYTRDLQSHISQADILVVAIGQPGVVRSEWIKPGAIVIDIGINRLADNTIVGDIEFATASASASWITPVPGGIGPMTVTTLLENTCKAAFHHYKN